MAAAITGVTTRPMSSGTRRNSLGSVGTGLPVSLNEDVVPALRSPGAIYNPRYALLTPSSKSASLKGREFFGSIDYEARKLGGRDVPGPSYTTDSSVMMGRSCSLKGRTYFGSIEYLAASGKDAPGPGEYEIKDAYTQRDNRPQAPALKSRVDSVQKPSNDLGPGQYFLGLQQDRVLSSRQSLRRISFGAPPARRNSLPGYLANTAHLGPGVYGTAALDGDSKLSTAPSNRTCTLGGKYRPLSGALNRVDPEVHKPMESTGKQSLSTKPTAPSAALKGRSRFGSPYNF